MAIDRTNTLSASAVYVNGELIPIMPNSLRETLPGETNVQYVSTGGLSGEIVRSIDASTLKGMLKFDVPNTAWHQDKAREWKEYALNCIDVTVTIVNKSTSQPYRKMTMTNTPEFEYASEGTFEVEFEGERVTS